MGYFYITNTPPTLPPFPKTWIISFLTYTRIITIIIMNLLLLLLLQNVNNIVMLCVFLGNANARIKQKGLLLLLELELCCVYVPYTFYNIPYD